MVSVVSSARTNPELVCVTCLGGTNPGSTGSYYVEETVPGSTGSYYVEETVPGSTGSYYVEETVPEESVPGTAQTKSGGTYAITVTKPKSVSKSVKSESKSIKSGKSKRSITTKKSQATFLVKMPAKKNDASAVKSGASVISELTTPSLPSLMQVYPKRVQRVQSQKYILSPTKLPRRGGGPRSIVSGYF
jgi:hypothetical protein